MPQNLKTVLQQDVRPSGKPSIDTEDTEIVSLTDVELVSTLKSSDDQGLKREVNKT